MKTKAENNPDFRAYFFAPHFSPNFSVRGVTDALTNEIGKLSAMNPDIRWKQRSRLQNPNFMGIFLNVSARR